MEEVVWLLVKSAFPLAVPLLKKPWRAPPWSHKGRGTKDSRAI